jgi:hypothetical protein
VYLAAENRILKARLPVHLVEPPLAGQGRWIRLAGLGRRLLRNPANQNFERNFLLTSLEEDA